MMSTSLEDGPLNGHLSPDLEFDQDVPAERGQTESDLSDSHREHVNEPSPTPPDSPNIVPNHVEGEVDLSDSDEPTPDNASDDAEFDMEESPPSQHEDAAETRSSSSDSNQAPKRKAAVVEDDFMRANPELYGLRRSVSAQYKLTQKILANSFPAPPTTTETNCKLLRFAFAPELLTDRDFRLIRKAQDQTPRLQTAANPNAAGSTVPASVSRII